MAAAYTCRCLSQMLKRHANLQSIFRSALIMNGHLKVKGRNIAATNQLFNSQIHTVCGNHQQKKGNLQQKAGNLLQQQQQQLPAAEEDSRSSDSFTHFGYDVVKENEKEKKVYEVFENVADSYDLMNDAMSMGVHRLWKTKYVGQLNVRPGMKVLDMAGGTGDIAFKILDSYLSRYPEEASRGNLPEIVISDINREMLEVGKKRAEKLGIRDSFKWVEANAEDLPFEDEYFDLYTIAFGIRNVTHIDRALDEAFRVLRIGGRLSCLEFSAVGNPLISEIYDTYSFEVIPVMGQVLAKDYDSYKYLVESIRKFPSQDDFAEMFYESGFSNVRYENLTFGVCAVHDGFKI